MSDWICILLENGFQKYAHREQRDVHFGNRFVCPAGVFCSDVVCKAYCRGGQYPESEADDCMGYSHPDGDNIYRPYRYAVSSECRKAEA